MKVNPKDKLKTPRIINIINLTRDVEPREQWANRNSYWVLINQIKLLQKYNLPATFLIQYDAMMNIHYQNLLKKLDLRKYEIGMSLEVVQPLVEKAGLKWRGRWGWDPDPNVGMLIGYTPGEREKLINVYIKDFKTIFGQYPRSVGAWIYDVHSLSYLAKKYGVIAACNCKDQWGTDSYTLWGGYWNQGYYPSKKNMFMPAQTETNRISVPIFRMLGSDPIYQYDLNLGQAFQRVISLEPVKSLGGKSPKWVRWFFDFTVNEPCLSFAYTQTGQENSFGMQQISGYEDQLHLIASLVKDGTLQVKTLRDAGEWFRSQFNLTPATTVTVLKDWKNQGHKTVWYNSRFYRVNLLWEHENFRIRDIHLFDENYVERYLTKTCKDHHGVYDTLPVLDGFNWSTKTDIAGIRPIEIKPNGEQVKIRGTDLKVTELNKTDLLITWSLKQGGVLKICSQSDRMKFSISRDTKLKDWVLEMSWAKGKSTPIRAVYDKTMSYVYNQYKYEIQCEIGNFSQPGETIILIYPINNQIILNLNSTKKNFGIQ